MSDWQSIETAPRDGTRILVYRVHENGYDNQRMGIDRWKNGNWWMSRASMPPTHWQPLPKPPTNQGADT